jgi:hypothetical protein
MIRPKNPFCREIEACIHDHTLIMILIVHTVVSFVTTFYEIRDFNGSEDVYIGFVGC